MSRQHWEVIGGADKGGIVVRIGKDLSSAATQDRLATGSIVEEDLLVGERLQFKLLSGTGPSTGWVSIKLKGKDLLIRRVSTGGEQPHSFPASVNTADQVQAGRVPRVVCLHGNGGGEAIFRLQLKRLLDRAEGRVEFVFLEGDKVCSSDEIVALMSRWFKGKPMMMYDEVGLDDRKWRTYKDIRKTLAWLQRKLQVLAPVDGLLGFSQGANFAVMAAAQASADVGVPISFVCVLCPNAPGYAAQIPELFSHDALRVPAMIVRGNQEGYNEGMKTKFDDAEAEQLGQRMPSAHVVSLFADAKTYTHSEGHRPLPQDVGEADCLCKELIGFMLQPTHLQADAGAAEADFHDGDYYITLGLLFKKTGEIMEGTKIIKLNRKVGSVVRTTGQIVQGAGGGLWVQLDTTSGDSGAGEKPGYVMIDAHGFGTPLPCLLKACKEKGPPQILHVAKPDAAHAWDGRDDDKELLVFEKTSIIEMKAMIVKLFNLEESRLEILDHDGSAMADEATTRDVGLRHGNTLRLTYTQAATMRLKVMNPLEEGVELLELSVESTWTIGQVKALLCATTGLKKQSTIMAKGTMGQRIGEGAQLKEEAVVVDCGYKDGDEIAFIYTSGLLEDLQRFLST